MYDILSHHSKDEVSDLETLRSFGFKTVKSMEVLQSQDLYESVKEVINSDWRDNEEFEIDGLVIKPIYKNKVEYDGDGHHAKGQIAIKFPPKGDTTYLRDIEFSVGKDGRMTPVAIYDPITIDGAVLSRASVGSWSNLMNLNVSIGDKIFVVRSNDVIPQIDAVLERYDDSKKIAQPEDTWISGAHLFTEVSEPIEDKFAKFAKQLNIKAFNSKTWKVLLDNHLIERYSDIFSLSDKREEMLKIKGLGEKKVDLLLEEIELSRRSTFEQLLNAMQYLAIGKKICKEISKHYSSVEELLNADENEIFSKVASLDVRAKSTISKLLNSDQMKNELLEVSKLLE